MFIIGADEVGYGACAGPLCVGAVRAPVEWNLAGLNDSKKLSPKKRADLSEKLWRLHEEREIAVCVATASNQEIDQEGVGAVRKRLFVQAIHSLMVENCKAIVDGDMKISVYCPCESIVKADSNIPTVMAASIVAKVHRDNFMQEMDSIYSGYGWDRNMGYVTGDHKKAMREKGLSELHRRSYRVKL